MERIELENFRNYKKASFEFSPQTSLFVGPNASGKTNLLEAIFLLATGTTFRPGREREMIRFGEEVGRVRGKVCRSIENNELSMEEVELEVVLTRGEVLGKRAPLKKLLANGVGKRLFDFEGNLAVVLFGPEDLNLVTGAPTLRRDFLDFVLRQVDREYRRRLVVFKKALVQRNRLLGFIREGKREKRELEYWDKILVENGSYLTEKRGEFFEFVNRLPKRLGNFEFGYWASEISFGRLEEKRREEIEAGMTLVGPQRDEFRFEVKSQKLKVENRDLAVFGSRGEPRKSLDLSVFGSRGEQRRAVLVLKLAQLRFMEKMLGEKPVLLLDDIFSELDKENRKEVFRVIPRQQTIITTTDLRLVEEEFLEKIKVQRLAKK